LQDKKNEILEYKSSRSQKQIRKPKSKRTISPNSKRRRQISISRRQEDHFNKFIQRKNKKTKSLQIQQKRQKEILFKNKMKDKFAFVGTKLGKMTKASIGKQRDKFDPKVHKAKGGVVLPGNIVRISGKAIPSWRQA
jgi:hypothetical protein